MLKVTYECSTCRTEAPGTVEIIRIVHSGASYPSEVCLAPLRWSFWAKHLEPDQKQPDMLHFCSKACLQAYVNVTGKGTIHYGPDGPEPINPMKREDLH